MAMIVRIIAVSLLTAGLGALLGFTLVRPLPDWPGFPDFLALLFACVGAVIGAVAGAAREIVTAMHQKPQGRQE